MIVWKIMRYILLALGLMFAAAVLFLRLWPPVGRLPGKKERRRLDGRSKHHRNGAFHNDPEVQTMNGGPSERSPRRRPNDTLPARTPALLPAPPAEALTFTWLGHSSFLLQIGGKNVLVDPVLSDRCSPVGFAGPRRFSERPLTAAALPRLDAVLISHDHYDHLDYTTIRQIRNQAEAFVVPLGLDTILRGWGVPAKKIRALDWWETAELGGLSVTLTPSQHFSGRDPLRGNSTLWGGMYVKSEKHSVYYTGDGGYGDAFRAVRDRLGAPDLMVGECGQYDPAWAKIHMLPEETVQAALDAGAAWLVPVHWGSFCICNHAWDDSIRRVTAAAKAAGLPLMTPRIGETVDYGRIAAYTQRWWEAYQ